MYIIPYTMVYTIHYIVYTIHGQVRELYESDPPQGLHFARRKV